MTTGPAVGACTVATRNYLADARLAARSFLDHHPGTRFTILVVDGDHGPPATWTHRDVELVTPSQLGMADDELLVMAAIYDPAELACALKPLALRRVLDRADIAVYVDGDVEVLDAMGELLHAAAETDVVLVPHVLEPLPRDGLMPDEAVLLGAGVYNGGLLACRRRAEDFLTWWEERLRRDCLNQPQLMLHGDQRWLDFVPTLFDHHILRDPTYDVAYWNLHERPTAWVEGRLCVVDRPVRCFHYSGLTDARPWALSGFAGDRPRVTLADRPAVARQCRAWLGRRRSVDAEGDRALGYQWAATARGVALDRRARMVWREALLAVESDPTGTMSLPPSPFASDGGEAWERWMLSADGGSDAGRYLQRVWAETPLLQHRFPAVPGADEPDLLRWAADPEADAAAIPDPFRPAPQEADVPVDDAVPRPRRPPRPDAGAQRPIDEIDRARRALDRAPDGTPGAVGRVVDRLLAGRDRRGDEATSALIEAVAEVTRRLADLSDRVDRTNDALFEQAGRTDDLGRADAELARTDGELARADADQRSEAGALGRRVDAVAADLAASRGDLDGALEQDRITAAILADAETRLADDLGELARRVAKLAETDTARD